MMTLTVMALGRTRNTAPSRTASSQQSKRRNSTAGKAGLPCLIQVQQHHDAELRRDTRQGNEADRARDRKLMTQPIDEPEAADHGERQCSHDEERFIHPLKNEVQQNEDHEQREWDDET